MAEIKGIDVSTWNEINNWASVKKAGNQFAVVRAGFGNTTTQQDKKFVEHMNGALGAGLAVGAYWFSYARSVDEARKEAQACLEVIKPYKSRITYPVFFDFEYDSEAYAEKAGVTVDRRFVTDVTRAFCETIRSAGYIAGYYTNQDYYKNKLYPEELADYDLWLADYTGGPEYTCAIQQFTSTGKVNGISGNVDMNVAFKEYGSKPTSSSKKYGTCTGDGVRIRKEAHTEGKVLGTANKGDKLELLGDDGWGWSKVKANGVTGWIYNEYVNGSGRSKPKTVHCSGTYVNLRKSPSTSAKVVRQLNPGDKVTLVSINPDGWLDVDGGYLYYDKSYLKIQ